MSQALFERAADGRHSAESASTIGKGSLAKALRSTVKAIEARQDARELAGA